ncbi:MAG: iron-containing alcohol dehydrogenase [Lachnospiraceae bacterium]
MGLNAEQYKISFPKKVFCGVDSIKQLKTIIEDNHAKQICLFTDQGVYKSGIVENIIKVLKETNVPYEVIATIPAEPSVDDLVACYHKGVQMKADCYLGVGGGSVMDVTKVVATAAANPDYIADIHNVGALKKDAQPMVMIPTTAGTGAEVTPNAIFYFPEKQIKEGIVSDKFLTDYVILDPTTTVGLSSKLTASTGLDAFCHAIEAYISKLSNPISDMFALKAIELISQNIENAYIDGTNLKARENMQLGAFYAGLCLCSSSTVAVHALSYPLGGKFRIPHGVANAMLLPHVMEENLDCCQEKFTTLAKIVVDNFEEYEEENLPECFITYLRDLTKRLQIPSRLEAFHVQKEDLDLLIRNALTVERLLSKNPKVLCAEDIKSIYNKLF